MITYIFTPANIRLSFENAKRFLEYFFDGPTRISLCSQGFYHKPFEAHLIATVHRAGIVGIGLVILLFHVVKIVHYLHHLVFGAVMFLQRRTKQAVGLGMTGITLLDMLD